MMINVIGYGSLLSLSSAKETAPSLKNFRLVKVGGYRRIFNKVGIVFFKMGGIQKDDLRISSCSTQKSKNTEMICSLFECSEEDFISIYEREHRFLWTNVVALDGRHEIIARMCTENTDENYLLNKCITESRYKDIVEVYYKGQIWRNDILPFTRYLQHCLIAARENGDDVYNNFIDTTFLADGKTTIRTYIAENQNLLEKTSGEYSYKKL